MLLIPYVSRPDLIENEGIDMPPQHTLRYHLLVLDARGALRHLRRADGIGMGVGLLVRGHSLRSLNWTAEASDDGTSEASEASSWGRRSDCTFRVIS